MPAWTDYTPESFADAIAAWGHSPVHAPRLLRTFYNDGGRIDLSDRQIGNALRTKLQTEIALRQSHVMHNVRSADGTQRLLVGLAAGGAVETVLMPSHKPDRAAGCVSSQIGCAMGCDFCASTRAGLQRSLTSGEIVEQFLHLKEAAAKEGRRLITLVFMGQGEPMHNLDNVMAAIRSIAGPSLGAMGWRHITVSTVGVVPGIDKLANSGLGVHLAVSLHAPDDETRS
jgi:23S rRNA (adenine2503-C2)-methyltransferase